MCASSVCIGNNAKQKEKFKMLRSQERQARCYQWETYREVAFLVFIFCLSDTCFKPLSLLFPPTATSSHYFSPNPQHWSLPPLSFQLLPLFSV